MLRKLLLSQKYITIKMRMNFTSSPVLTTLKVRNESYLESHKMLATVASSIQ
jgi:hypothetical protein